MKRTFKILLPTIPLVAIAVAVGTSGHPAVAHDQTGSAPQASADNPSPAVDVTVNGQPVNLPPSGFAHVNTGSGSATISVNKGGEVKTQVTNSSNSNVNVSVSTSSNGGNSSSHTSFTTNGFQQTSNNSDVQVDTFSQVTSSQ